MKQKKTFDKFTFTLRTYNECTCVSFDIIWYYDQLDKNINNKLLSMWANRKTGIDRKL